MYLRSRCSCSCKSTTNRAAKNCSSTLTTNDFLFRGVRVSNRILSTNQTKCHGCIIKCLFLDSSDPYPMTKRLRYFKATGCVAAELDEDPHSGNVNANLKFFPPTIKMISQSLTLLTSSFSRNDSNSLLAS